MTSTASPLRIIFAGTPEFAAHHLAALLNSPHQVVAVYTQPDRPAGRGKKLKASPVKQMAAIQGLPIEQPLSLKTPEALDRLVHYKADLMVVVAYGLLLPVSVIDALPLGCINVHGSLLPRWRGAAPIARAIEAGDTETGITTMQMDKGLDTGDMLMLAQLPIKPDDNSQRLHDKLMVLGAKTLLSTLERASRQELMPTAQNDQLATYAQKIDKSEANIDWNQSSELINRQIRAFNPAPMAYTFLNEERIKVHEATPTDKIATGVPGSIAELTHDAIFVNTENTMLKITKLQLPGKKAMPASVLLNGQSSLFENQSFHSSASHP